MDFTAIDFETASHRKDSACQLAAVRVRDGRIVDSACWLIRPQPCFFSPANIRIHGITPARVQGEPTFGELWHQIDGWLREECLVAHNASFDIGVLLACLRAHRQKTPELSFTCTRSVARRTWPGRHSYGLKPLSDWLGIRFQHHDALEDSVACAKVLLAAAVDRSVETVSELESRLKLTRGAAGDWGYSGATAGRQTRRTGDRDRPTTLGRSRGDSAIRGGTPPADKTAKSHPLRQLDLQRLLIRAEFIQSLAGKQIVFTGRLQNLAPTEAQQLATCLGGCCQDKIDDQTNLLVTGSPSEGDSDARTAAAGRTISVQEQVALDRQRAGQSIQIIDETAFLGLVLHPDSARQCLAAEGPPDPP